MANVPLAFKLRRREHRALAAAQDLVVLELYGAFPRAVLHGGTAIWRCYKGSRFSEDLDVYLPQSARKAVDSFLEGLKRRGLARQKFKETENAMFGKFTFGGFPVRVEALFKDTKSYTVRPFEMTDGTFITANVLEPSELILEKTSAYADRRKVRDLYDIFYLTHLTDRSGNMAREVRKLLANFKPPQDPSVLRTLIIAGSVPTVRSMLEELERWAR
ncbi:MAG: nucleotidyl transferase AbiEii/AbiGii toxin family protein [Nitrososphaerales archaeon]|nr:nucleotidyl transferase AbiEii/AbiGii toxin family protein [Nitrososphaerales archaeon]